jgi:hypothetical protein
MGVANSCALWIFSTPLLSESYYDTSRYYDDGKQDGKARMDALVPSARKRQDGPADVENSAINLRTPVRVAGRRSIRVSSRRHYVQHND